MTYKIVKNYFGQEVGVNKLQDNGTILGIPFDPANTDYQKYLKWLAEGNEPLPADAPEQA
jgi:hypothetical protein